MVAIHFIACSAVEFLIIYVNILAQLTLFLVVRFSVMKMPGEKRTNKLNN